jgi:hypothetical protein
MPEPQLAQIESVHIQWECGGTLLLSLYMSRSGAVNRAGSGDGDPARALPCMGRSSESLFEQWIEALSSELLAHAGRYEFAERQGEDCQLTLTLGGEAFETGFAFRYGTESQGPPEEIAELVSEAIRLTDPWYEEQLSRRRHKS